MPRIYCFTEETLQQALEDWAGAATEAYPHQAERIELTLLAMQDFFHDEALIRRHKMIVPEAES